MISDSNQNKKLIKEIKELKEELEIKDGKVKVNLRGYEILTLKVK